MGGEAAASASTEELVASVQRSARDLAAASAAAGRGRDSRVSGGGGDSDGGDGDEGSAEDSEAGEDSDGANAEEEAGLLRSLLAAREQRIRALECLQQHDAGRGAPLEAPIDSAAPGPPGEGPARCEGGGGGGGPIAFGPRSSGADAGRACAISAGDEAATAGAERDRLVLELENLRVACGEQRAERDRLLAETEEARSQYERASKILTELSGRAREKRAALEELERRAAEAAAVGGGAHGGGGGAHGGGVECLSAVRGREGCSSR